MQPGEIPVMERVLVVGTSGAGKSTLAERIAARLGLPFHASDPFYWEADWRPASTERVDRLLDQVLHAPRWVLDGNFEHRWRDVWARAQCVVWLDYPLAVVLWQVATRNLRWLVHRDVVWSGNRMTLRRALSGFRHALRSHAGKRRRYRRYIAELRDVPVVRFSSRQEAASWLSTLAPRPATGKATAA